MTSPAAARWGAARSVLAVRLDNLGDVLMTTPALAAIRESRPDARITLLTSPSGGALAPLLPIIDDTIAAEVPWVRPQHAPVPEPFGRSESELLRRLAAGRYDAAVIFTVRTQSALPAALLLRMAGIPLRLAASRENPYALLSDWLPDTEVVRAGMRHEVERQLALVAQVGWQTADTRLRLQTRRRDAEQARAALAAAGLRAGAGYFVVHPGASAASRRWAPERFGQAAAALARASGLVALFCGSSADEPFVQAARAHAGPGAIVLPPSLEFGALAVVIGGARLVLCNNSAPAHIAAAMGTPVVVLYALTNPQHTPWQVPSRVLNHDVECRHCLKSTCPRGHHDCLAKVPADAAVAAALELLAHGHSAWAA